MRTAILPRRPAASVARRALDWPTPDPRLARGAPRAPLLVALAGTAGDAAVLAAARALTVRLGAPPVAVTVREAGSEAHAVELGCTPGASTPWPVEVAFGPVASALARAATRRKARMLVMGPSHHDPWDQLVGDETSLHVLRETERPVLVVARPFRGLPRRAVLATGFGPASHRAAAEALALLPPGGTLVLAHVVWRRVPRRQSPSEAWSHAHERPVGELLDELEARLEPPEGVRIERAVLTGDPAGAILAHARATGAELVAAGVSGTRAGERMYVGSVPTTLLRRATCSVLVTAA